MAQPFVLDVLTLKVSALGEYDRLLTVLSAERGIERLAVPGARRPRSSLAAAAPLCRLLLQVAEGRSLGRVRQLQVIRSYAALGQRLETLAAAQWLAEVCLLLVPSGDSVEGVPQVLLFSWEQLLALADDQELGRECLAQTLQSTVHLLAWGGYGLPLDRCMLTGAPLDPPLGQWDWHCGFYPADGFAIGATAGSLMGLNPSELALLQRLQRERLPRRRNGVLMGPLTVWRRLLRLITAWLQEHLGQAPRSLSLLDAAATAEAGPTGWPGQRPSD